MKFYEIRRKGAIMNITKIIKLPSIHDDVAPLLKLCIPLILIGLMQSSIYFFENIFLAKLGPSTLAAGGLVSWFFSTIMVVIFGTLSAVNVLVAHKHGENNIEAISKITRDGFILALLFVIPVFLLVWNVASIFLMLGQHPSVVILAKNYLQPLSFSLLPRFIIIVFSELLLGLGLTRVITVFTVCTVPLYLLATYALIFGAWGMPALGIAGAGWGITIGDCISVIVLTLYIFSQQKYKPYLKNITHFSRPYYLKEILALGLPMGLMYCVEVGFFFVVALFMGVISIQTLSANQLTMQYLGALIGTIFSMAQGLTIRMGHLIGAKNIVPAFKAVNAAILIVFIYMCLIAVFYLFFPTILIGIDFDLNNPDNFSTIMLAKQLLRAAAIFQILESIRITLYGALRGLKDTHYPLLASVISFWGISLPLGYLFSSVFKFGGIAFWWAMILGTTCSVTLLTRRYQRKMKHYSILPA